MRKFLIIVLLLITLTGCTTKENDSIVKESSVVNFSDDFLGDYFFENDITGDTIYFTLSKNDGGYYYTFGFYPKDSNHASEEFYGDWDITKDSFIPKNENGTAIGEYVIENIKYEDDTIIFDTRITDLLNEEYKYYIIPNGTYELKKSTSSN